MGQCTRTLAFITAFFLASGGVQAESAGSRTESRAVAAPLFADSFGLNGALRTSAGKRPDSAPAAGKALPAADSFGLNNGVLPTLVGCSASAGTMAAAQGSPQRCIEI